MMKRRTFLCLSAGVGYVPAFSKDAFAQPTASDHLNPLAPPDGPIRVAFLISRNAVVIDFAGPWEVFQDVRVPGRRTAFELYTVAETTEPVPASAGLMLVPHHTFATAPAPRLVVVPAQGGASGAALEWIREVSKQTDITMSVCTGALLLAKTGLFAGKAMTTHHGAYAILASQNPDVKMIRGARWVDNGSLASSGGLSSGIDLALHVVDRYSEFTGVIGEHLGTGPSEVRVLRDASYAPLATAFVARLFATSERRLGCSAGHACRWRRFSRTWKPEPTWTTSRAGTTTPTQHRQFDALMRWPPAVQRNETLTGK